MNELSDEELGYINHSQGAENDEINTYGSKVSAYRKSTLNFKKVSHSEDPMLEKAEEKAEKD